MSDVPSWHQRLARLTRMSRAELLTRARQGLMKRWDAVIPPRLPKIRHDGTKSKQPRFFFSSEEIPCLIELMRQLLPDHVLRIQDQADRICQHRFDLLGYENLDYGAVVDWHLDAVSGKRAPRLSWSKVPYLTYAEVGDHKVVWELNRHQHFITLAKAYCLTRNECYVIELCNQWYQWNKENPNSIGINWCSSLEVSFRTLSWLWARHLLENCPVLPSNFQSDLLIGLAQNGRHICKYLSSYFSPNTHLLGEAVALFFLGTLCPQIPRAGPWQRRGWTIIQQEANRQIQNDGIYFEQSIYYHVYALDLFLHARILAELNQWPIPSSLDHRIELMAEALSVLGQDGTIPRVGDDDGGRVFDPRRNATAHEFDPLSTAAVLYERPDFKALSGGFREESLWLLGADAARKFAELPVVSPNVASRAFESSGFYVMASEAPLTKLVMHAGRMGALRAGHSHCDLLAINLSIDGRDCLTDPGTLRYVPDFGERDHFRGTAAHNTLRIDHCDQAKPCDTFSWNSLPAVGVQEWIAGHTFDLLAAEHYGYGRLEPPAIHRRWVFFLKPHFWFVRDVIEGEGHHLLEMFWHLAPSLVWQNISATSFVAVDKVNAEDVLTLLAEEHHSWSQELREGCHSPVYGKRTASSVLEFIKETDLPAEFATMLLPVASHSARLVALETTGSKNGAGHVVGYRCEEPTERHYIFFARDSKPWRWQSWASDAAFLYLCLNTKAELSRLVLCKGSFVEIDGRRVFDVPHLASSYEWFGSAEP